MCAVDTNTHQTVITLSAAQMPQNESNQPELDGVNFNALIHQNSEHHHITGNCCSFSTSMSLLPKSVKSRLPSFENDKIKKKSLRSLLGCSWTERN